MVTEPAMRPGQSGSQALEHLGTAGGHGRAENEVKYCGLDLAQDGKKRGDLRLVLWGQAGFGLVAGSIERLFFGRLDDSSIDEGLL